MVKVTSDGGLKDLHLDRLSGTLKINWLKSWIKCHSLFCFCIPNFLFNQLGGLKLLLISDFDVNKLPESLSEFHEQMLLFWKMFHTSL